MWSKDAPSATYSQRFLLLITLLPLMVSARITSSDGGISLGPKPMYPQIFNLASRAEVTANATCGETENGPEVYCKFGGSTARQCGVCDSRAGDPAKNHGPANAVDNSTGTWWQSPSLQNGDQYQYVTVTVNLKQVYQVSYIIIKFGISSRPGNWILERSTDGVQYKPWQYFAVSGEECVQKYGIQPTLNKDKVVQIYHNPTCITSFSRFKPHENAEIHVYLLKGHNHVNLSSDEVLGFSTAQYIRLRLQKIITPPNEKLITLDESYKRKLFYSIKDIAVGGRCVCNGHAKKCKQMSEFEEPRCDCIHNTCGSNCDRCCPLFNQRPWKPGPVFCEKCQCNGHATECQYDPIVDREKSSLDIYGTYSGGGICINCLKHTAGTNCELCDIGWYRPNGVKSDDPEPCLACDCHPDGSDGNMCIPDKDTGVGVCNCLKGYTGDKCTECAPGYNGFPNCKPCACDEQGTKTPPSSCEDQCDCKVCT